MVNVENVPVGTGVYWSPALKRAFIADWLKLHGLFERLDGVRIVGELPEAEPIWDEINRMLRETSR